MMLDNTYNKEQPFYFFDAHSHLQEPEISWDMKGIISRWRQNRGKTIVCCGTKESDWQNVLNIASKYNEIIPCFGVHPWFVQDVSEKWFYKLDSFLDVNADNRTFYKPFIGEIGLDHVIKNIDNNKQEIIFKTQMGMAKERQIPVSIHIRKGWDILLKVLKQIGTLKAGGMIHSYSGSADLIPILEKYGLYISFSGSITHSNNKKVQKSLKAVSINRLLIETDSPAILPRFYLTSDDKHCGSQQNSAAFNHKSKWVTKLFNIGLNEPCNIFMVAGAIAELLGISISEAAHITALNGERLFYNSKS